jgi:hypothetical protein
MGLQNIIIFIIFACFWKISLTLWNVLRREGAYIVENMAMIMHSVQNILYEEMSEWMMIFYVCM